MFNVLVVFWHGFCTYNFGFKTPASGVVWLNGYWFRPPSKEGYPFIATPDFTPSYSQFA
jgi:hypothetical protein